MEFRAHEMGGSPCALQICWHFRRIALSPAFAGLKIFCAYLGLAPQALCGSLLRRLKLTLEQSPLYLVP